MLRTSPVRVLSDRDVPDALAVCDRDPVANVFVASRIAAVGLESWRLGAEVWGHIVDGKVDALCFAGANLVPVQASEEAARSFAGRARRFRHHCSSIVGPADAVEVLWQALEPSWGPARDVRIRQPLMAIDSSPLVTRDPGVRPVRPNELDLLLPACVAMFTEEVGVSPSAGDGGLLYRARVAELISQGRSFARIDDGVVVFKAEIGAATSSACQVQGVWVNPALRGKGYGTAGTAAVVALSRQLIAPTVSLYVNDYNQAARRVYQRVGFREVGTFASILF